MNTIEIPSWLTWIQINLWWLLPAIALVSKVLKVVIKRWLVDRPEAANSVYGVIDILDIFAREAKPFPPTAEPMKEKTDGTDKPVPPDPGSTPSA